MAPWLLVALTAVAPLAIRVEVQPLGSGGTGTVVGVAVQVAPEDRERAGGRVEVETVLLRGSEVVDRETAVVELQGDGSALLYREWPPGEGELRVRVSSLGGGATGAWSGKLVVPVEREPFVAPSGAAPEAVALAPALPPSGGVRFLPPARPGGIGPLQLEVQVPDATVRVEFSQDGQQLLSRNRSPWTVSVNLGEVARRTVVQAAAFAADGAFLGEDALILNGAPGQVSLEILLGPVPAGEQRERTVTVAANGMGKGDELTLRLDDAAVARWAQCPCVVQLPISALAKAKVLTAEVRGGGKTRGDAVQLLSGGGFVESVRVEEVELPVVVVDANGRPVPDLGRGVFRVFEDGVEVELDGFATNTDLPLALGVVVDISGSMKDTFPAVRQAVSGFATNLLRQGDRTFLMTFSFEPRIVVPWTREPSQLEQALERVEPEGGTALHDAVVRALEPFRSERGRKAVVLLTDGDDTASRTGWEVALRFARTLRTPVFPIGFRISLLDFFVRERLKDLAEATGAEAYFARDITDLKGVYQRIGELLRSQYLLSYRSPSETGREKFRSVRVEVAGEGLTARTIAGYFPTR